MDNERDGINPFTQPFNGVIWIEFLCPNCDKLHYERFGALDPQGVGLDLALQWSAWREDTGLIKQGSVPRFLSVEPTEEHLHALEFRPFSDGEQVIFRYAVLPPEEAGKATMRMASFRDAKGIFDYVRNHGTDIYAEPINKDEMFTKGGYCKVASRALQPYAELVVADKGHEETTAVPAAPVETVPENDDDKLRKLLGFLK